MRGRAKGGVLLLLEEQLSDVIEIGRVWKGKGRNGQLI